MESFLAVRLIGRVVRFTVRLNDLIQIFAMTRIRQVVRNDARVQTLTIIGVVRSYEVVT